MSNFYDRRSGSFSVDISNEREVFRSSPSGISYDFRSPMPAGSEAETPLDATILRDHSDAESGVPAGLSYESSYFFQSRSRRQPLTQHRFNSSYNTDPVSDTRFPQSNSFSALRDQLSPLAMAGQENMYILDATDTTPHLTSYENCQATPSFASSPLSNTQNPSYVASNSYFPAYGDTSAADKRSYEYAEAPDTRIENWSFDSSLSNRNNTLDGVAASVMPTTPVGQISHFSNREEALPANSIVSPSCYACNPPLVFENLNYSLLHHWHAHPPPASSLLAWKPQTCKWDTCTLEKEFRTHKSWVDHAYNVHYPRFWCRREGCKWRKPFGSQNLVNRHIRTVHDPPQKCKIPGCQGSKNKIVRKDKRDEHNANFHGSLVCEVADCPRGCIDGQNHGFSEPADLAKHSKTKHKHLGSQKIAT